MARLFEEVGEQNIRAKWDSYYLSITYEKNAAKFYFNTDHPLLQFMQAGALSHREEINLRVSVPPYSYLGVNVD